MDVTNLSGRTVVVTGAASGIGKQTALAFGRRGADLAICDVDEAGLQQTVGELQALGRQVVSRRVDVANLDEMQAFADQVHADVDAVDIVVNNAGVGLAGGFLDTSIEDWQWIVGINLWGVIHGCHCFVPPMVARGSGGHVVNVSSVAGFLGSATLAAYSTTKFAVFGLSEAMREELTEHGIGVTTICPGFINTPILEHARRRGQATDPELYQRVVNFYKRRGYTAERVAANIVKAVGRNRGVTPVAAEAWFLYYLKRTAPTTLARIARRGTARARGAPAEPASPAS